MIALLAIFQYLLQALVDLMDKFLISVRKIEPVSYTFFTVVTGLCLLVFWPWSFYSLSFSSVWLDVLSGIMFTLAMFVFFVNMAEGEVSSVVPYIFGLVPVFDLLLAQLTGRGRLELSEAAAIMLLIPGALLVSHRPHSSWARHAALKTLSAFLFSCYYLLWQYAAQTGPVMNNLMWNRIGAAAPLLLLLFWPAFRKKVFVFKSIKHPQGTSALFLFKQLLGGANFIFLSSLLVVGKITIINALQGFRYVFLLIFGYMLSRRGSAVLSERTGHKILTQKTFGVALIFLGTLLLFL